MFFKSHLSRAISLLVLGIATLLTLLFTLWSANPAHAQDESPYQLCINNRSASDTPGVNDPVHLKPIGLQRGYVNQAVILRLHWCDPENEAPGTIAHDLPTGASLPDNLDGTRSFYWIPQQAVETEVRFTVYEESEPSIRTSIVVPFVIAPSEGAPDAQHSGNGTSTTNPAPPPVAESNDEVDLPDNSLDANPSGNSGTSENADSDNTESGAVDEPDAETKRGSEPAAYAITLAPDIPLHGSSGTARYKLEGKIISIGNTPYPAHIHFHVTDDRGAQIDRGTLSVSNSGDWNGSVPLLAGNNRISLSAVGAETALELTVVHNPGFQFNGLLELQPDVVYVNESRLITARIALPAVQAEKASVYLVRTYDDAIVANLSDDGNLGNGDEIERDGIYSALFSVNRTIAGELLDYRVEVQFADGREAISEAEQLLVTERYDPEELREISVQQAVYQNILLNTDPANTVQTLENIAVDLADDPLVADYGLNEDGNGLWIIYANGLPGAIQSPRPGTKGSASFASTDSPYKPTAKTIDDLHLSALYEEPFSVLEKHAVDRASKHANTVPPPYSRYCKPGNERRDLLSLYSDDTITAAITAAPTTVAPTTDLPGIATINADLAEKAIRFNRTRSSKVLAIAAQYWDWGETDDVPLMQKMLADDGCHQVNYKRYLSKGSGSVEDFKNLGDYGTILISSHGDSFYAGVDSAWQQRFGWNGSSGQIVVDSNMFASEAHLQLYEDDLQTGRLVLWGTTLGITPTFIRQYSGTLPNSLVYLSVCRGTWNASMASAFINNGAGTFLGYDNYVTVAFCLDTGPALIQSLLQDGTSLSQAFTAGQFDPYTSESVEFDLIGDNDLSLANGELLDAGFEQLDLTQAWQVEGDARLIQSLGEYQSSEGVAMAVISTGLGYSTSAGALSQTVCLCEGLSTISFDWNFLSEEWLEYVGSGFQDAFTVTLHDTEGAVTPVTLFHQTIDSLAHAVSPVDHAFDQNDVYATGWQRESTAIPATLSGRTVVLTFEVSDMGDSIFDSAVLLDNLRLECTDHTAAIQQ